MNQAPAFAELVATTNFSFLRGASHPHDMVLQARTLGMQGIGIADRNSVAGVVRAHVALKDLQSRPEPGKNDQFRLAVGARLVFTDGTPDIVAYPATRVGWGMLTRLLTLGNRRASKGDCILWLEDLLATLEGRSGELLLIIFAGPADEALLQRLVSVASGSLWIAAAMPHRGDDRRRLARMAAFARAADIPLLATNDALYAAPEQKPLHDVVTCIREGVTVAEAGRLLLANAERHLKPPAEMARLFRDCPDAVDESIAILDRITFRLEDLRYEYPHEPVPEGWEPQAWLEHISWEAARTRYPEGIPDRLVSLLDTEFALIRDRCYAYYFLTVYELVKFARSLDPPILCQGRGSAANSAVCFLLGITSVDPMQHDLLFSRFVSVEREEPPDIDVDFEHERREEVMQHIYARYGRERAGIAATVIHYRPRSAVREVGKVLGLSEDVTRHIVSTVWGSHADRFAKQRFVQAGLDPANPNISRLHTLVDQLLNTPRHLSQHVGGFVLTEGRLDELVPIHNAAMPDRTFIEWDKDDIDALGLMKVDVLALGMLTCIRKAFDLMRLHDLGNMTLDTIAEEEDGPVYQMLCKGDSIGVFQVESRAQINMLPRLRPREFYDLVIQVAIVRPGPIEGDMVHPYLRRRAGQEAVDYPSPAPPHPADELRTVLGKTYGVPLFQEQVMKLAITAADFTPEEANQLRRAMATFRNVGTISHFETKMIEGMVARGYERDFAERCYKQIKGFGSYGFPESHALSFARLVYVSAWIKCYHPAIFACALLNAQPMGFYAPAQIVRDAREHGVEVRPADVNASQWDSILEPLESGGHALRLGFRQIDGFREDWAAKLTMARTAGSFNTIEALARRTHLPDRALRLLADADACRSIGKNRRDAMWETRRMPGGAELPLFAATRAAELAAEPEAGLPKMPLAEQVVTDYQTTGLSLRQHPLFFLRDRLRADGILSSAELASAQNGMRAKVAGVVLVRQRPGKGNAIFVTIEDETGIINILLWARMLERYRRPLMASRLMLAEGEVQKSPEGVIHLMASRIEDRTAMLDSLSDGFNQPICQTRPQHPRDVRIVPKSRDFH